MKRMMLAAAAVLSLGAGAAFAQENSSVAYSGRGVNGQVAPYATTRTTTQDSATLRTFSTQRHGAHNGDDGLNLHGGGG